MIVEPLGDSDGIHSHTSMDSNKREIMCPNEKKKALKEKCLFY